MTEAAQTDQPTAPGAQLLAGAHTVLGAPAALRDRLLREVPQPRLLDLYRGLCRLRAFDDRALTLQRQGRIGTYATYRGEEAVQAGSVLALTDRDWVFPTYRQGAVVTLRGVAPEVPLLLWSGHPGGWHDVHRSRVAPICVPVATNLPHAVGAAWGARLRGETWVALGFAGDGATSEGDFHEACNLAAVMEAPAIIVVTNNQWAISTPISAQTRVTRIADKAAAYGMPGVRVDGFDVVACHQVVSAAAARARAGGGPTLVEAVCYRLGPHGTADEPSLYRDQAAARAWEPMEPVARTTTALVAAGVASPAELEAIREELATEHRDLGRAIEAVPAWTAAELAGTVHDPTPWTLGPEGLAGPVRL